jgi:hypothetical protein
MSVRANVAIGLAFLGSIVPASSIVMAEGSTDAPSKIDSPLRFEVRLGGLPPQPEAPRDLRGRLLVVIGKPDGGEPRTRVGRTGMSANSILGRDVENFKPGAIAVLDGRSAIFPIERLDRLPAGTYAVQALLHLNQDLNLPNAPGDLYSDARTIHLDPSAPQTVSLELGHKIPEERLPPDSGSVRYLKIHSKKLSDFHGRPIDLRAGIILPRDFDREPDRRYPLRVHVGGLGSRFTKVGSMMAEGSAFARDWNADDAPRMVLLHLDGAGPYGDPYQVNSANHGPFGDAIVEELIPWVEARYRCIGKGSARGLDGGSTGGWAVLALQIFYPDTFNGAWASCPDSVDFRNFELINIYKDDNAYINSHGFERPGARDISGDVRYTMRHELTLENVLGLGDSWTTSGGQWGAWNATYSPRGADGRPVPLWDPRTGKIDHHVAEAWRRYDLREILESRWSTLGPRLRGKLHIDVGEADGYFLNNAVHRLDDFLSRAEPAYEGTIRYGPRQGHCWSGSSQAELSRAMASRICPDGR